MPKAPSVRSGLAAARRRQRSLVGGPRANVRRRGLRPERRPEPETITVDGHFLNVPETAIYRALVDLNIPFEPQVSIGGGRELGGGIADFYLPLHKVIIEYQGPFHNTTAGRARDFFREATRKSFGALAIIPIYEGDLPNIRTRLLDLIGAPMSYAVARG